MATPAQQTNELNHETIEIYSTEMKNCRQWRRSL